MKIGSSKSWYKGSIFKIINWNIIVLIYFYFIHLIIVTVISRKIYMGSVCFPTNFKPLPSKPPIDYSGIIQPSPIPVIY